MDVSIDVKGQFISKTNCQAMDSSKKRTNEFVLTKGQFISKCPFGIIVWTKIPTKLFLDFCPEIF